MEEAVEWVKRCPNPMQEESDLEIRTLLTAYVIDTIDDIPAAIATDTDSKVSLREAITAANTNAVFSDAAAGQGAGVVDTITFDASLTGQTIVLGGEQLLISDDLSIIGLGQNELTISGNDASRVFFNVFSGDGVEISNQPADFFLIDIDSRFILAG